MIFLIPSGRFLPRRRPQLATDELPLRPLVDVILFWALLALGGLFTTVVAMQIYAYFAMDVPVDRMTAGIMIGMAIAAPLCLAYAWRFWERLRR